MYILYMSVNNNIKELKARVEELKFFISKENLQLAEQVINLYENRSIRNIKTAQSLITKLEQDKARPREVVKRAISKYNPAIKVLEDKTTKKYKKIIKKYEKALAEHREERKTSSFLCIQ